MLKFSLQINLPKVTNLSLDFQVVIVFCNIVIGLLDAVVALCLKEPILIQTTSLAFFCTPGALLTEHHSIVRLKDRRSTKTL